MSLWTVRKPLKTYSRSKKRAIAEEEPPPKRRRIENSEDDEEQNGLTRRPERESVVEPSSPITVTHAFPTSSPREPQDAFSDGPLASSPPSSPAHHPSSPPLQTQFRRPLFSIFKKQQRSPTATAKTSPLSDRSLNIQSSPAPHSKKKRLVQMQLDLVGELRKTCKVCGMEYIPSNTEDEKLHRKFHAMNVGGVDLTKALVEKLKQKEVWSGNGGFIAVIGRKDTNALRNKAVEVLKVVNTELAAVTIPEKDLWSQVQNLGPEGTAVPKDDREAATAKRRASVGDRFKVYLYIQGSKCVGACLAERIHEAHVVEDEGETSQATPIETESSSVSVGTATEPAILGISRIWTSNLHRKQGIASRLLEVACTDFLYGMTIGKEMMAFSQPTESGGKLARKWFGRQAGWHVYID